MPKVTIKQRFQHTDIIPILLASFFSTTGRGLTLPFLPLFVHKFLSAGIIDTGRILTVAITLGILLSVPTGKLADHYNHRVLSIVSLLIFSLSFILIITVPERIVFITGLTLINMSASLFSSIVKCYLSENYSGIDKDKFFSVNYTVVNIGWMLGPALGSLLYIKSTSVPFFLSACCGVVALVSVGWVSFNRIRENHLNTKQEEHISLPASRWVVLILFTAGIFFSTFVYGRFGSCISQILMTQIDDIGTSRIISMLVSVNAGTVIFFQYFITVQLCRLGINQALIIGMLFLLAGISIFSISGSNIYLWSVGVFIFSFGEIIFIPLQYKLIDSVATTGNRALCFSFQNLGDLGGAINPLVTAFILSVFSVSMVYYSLIASIAVSVTLFLCGDFFHQLIKKTDHQAAS